MYFLLLNRMKNIRHPVTQNLDILETLIIEFLILFFCRIPYVSRIRCKSRDVCGHPATRIQSSFGFSDRPETFIHPLSRNNLPPCATVDPRVRSSIFLFSSYRPPALFLFLLSWTSMETVASWHGEVNYKRYQSLGVVGWLVGLGSTDSQLPLRANPRARAIPSSLALLPLSLSLSLSFYLIHQHPASFPLSSILRPHISDESRRFDALGAI